ncbi:MULTISPECIES: hypothetical protein [unclassified Leucobacter]|nr:MULTISPECIES: hypothetical protein [unclassified Leucobacter]
MTTGYVLSHLALGAAPVVFMVCEKYVPLLLVWLGFKEESK